MLWLQRPPAHGLRHSGNPPGRAGGAAVSICKERGGKPLGDRAKNTRSEVRQILLRTGGGQVPSGAGAKKGGRRMHWALGRKTRCFPTAVRPIGGGIYAEPGIEEFLRWDLDGGEMLWRQFPVWSSRRGYPRPWAADIVETGSCRAAEDRLARTPPMGESFDIVLQIIQWVCFFSTCRARERCFHNWQR